MGNRLRAYLRILRLCFAHTRRLNLGDYVRYNGRRCVLVQGNCAPSWHMHDTATDERFEYVHERDFRKERTLRNLWHDVRFAWDFYRGYWFDIWVMEYAREAELSSAACDPTKGDKS